MDWKTAPVDSKGTQLAYLDSGAPPTSDYTTFVIVHGHSFHAPTFSRLLSPASRYNARIIAVNRRDYVHSTPLSGEELNALAGKDEDAHSRFLRDRGLEIARFLCYVITELNIPQASSKNDATSSGGLAIMGWSLGNLFSIAFVANLETYPPEVLRILEPYLKSLFIYAQAAPIMFLGYPNPPDAWNPFCAPENEEHVAKEEFGIWAMSYYKHPAFSGTRTSDVTPASFIQYTPEQQYRPPTSANISTDEMVMIIDPEPNGRSERFFLEMSSSMMHGSLEKAMLGVNVGLLPRLGICYVYGQADVWIVAWAACQFERDLERWRDSGEHIRPTKVLSVPGANHMFHWDDPDMFLKLITKGEV